MRFLIGLFLILFLSPLIVWIGESQHRAKDFAAAVRVASEERRDGYVVVEGAPIVASPLACSPDGSKSCIMEHALVEQYLPVQKTVCSDTPPSQATILRSEEPECDEYGSCDPCWLVEQNEWTTSQDITSFAPFVMGAYSIEPTDKANFVGLQTEITSSGVPDPDEDPFADPEAGAIRKTYEYLPVGSTMLVAGDAFNGVIRSAQTQFVISDMGYDATRAALKQQDKGTAIAMRIFSAFMMMAGFMFLVSPLLSVTGAFANLIPFIGNAAHGPLKAAVYFLAATVGLLVWLVVWLAVLFLKNLWWISIVLLIVGLLALFVSAQQKKRSAQSKK